jgi:hypothetical protein
VALEGAGKGDTDTLGHGMAPPLAGLVGAGTGSHHVLIFLSQCMSLDSSFFLPIKQHRDSSTR